MLNNLENARHQCYEMRTQASTFFELQIIPTTECNFRCTYCYETKYHSKLKLEDVKLIIDKMFDFEDNLDYWGGENFFVNKEGINKNHIEINFFGGECTLEIELMDEILDYFVSKCNENPEKYGIRLEHLTSNIQSNGSLFLNEKVQNFIKKWKERIGKRFTVYMTIDGCKKFHDMCRVFKDTGKPTFDIVKKGLEWYKNTFNEVPITKGTVNKQTLPYLYETFLGYIDLGYNSFRITPATGVQFDDNDAKIYKEQLMKIADYLLQFPDERYFYQQFSPIPEFKDRKTHFYGIGSCRCNGTGVTIYPNGKLYTCHIFSPLSFTNNSKNIDPSIGTVKDGVSSNGLCFIDGLRHMVDETVFTADKCKSCLAIQACEFCPGQNLQFTGDINKDPKYNCQMKKIEQFVGALYYYRREKLYGKSEPK